MSDSNPEMKSLANNGYSEESIKVLEGLEAVRKRPAMYIGDVSERGLHHLIQEVVDNSIDEALAGYCTDIIVTLHADGGCSIEDNGRGIPTGPHPVKKISTLEVVMCTLHAGGKFDKNTYKVSGGLHGVGVSCVNALSSFVEVTVQRDGKVYKQEYRQGKPTTPVRTVGESKGTGTKTYFRPDDSIFKTTVFKFQRVADRLRELAFLNKEVSITLRDERENEEETFHFEGGLKDFVDYIDSANTIFVKPVYIQGSDIGESETETQIEVCFQYNTGFAENLLSYVNNINTTEGGTHVTGFRSALTRTLNSYAQANAKKNNKVQLVGDDFREGLTAIISVKVAEPQFEGQTKTKLGNNEVEGIVRTIVNEKLAQFLDENPTLSKRIIEKAVLAAEARIAAKKSRELVRRKNALESSTLPGKLADCSLNSPEDTEVYLVEGDSAGGSAKQGRDRRFQAILPLRGKVLNVQKARLAKILENEEIRTIFTALGTGFGEDFDIEKLRYGKIILMADADVDGSHIRTLLLTLFYNYMRDLVLEGKLYIAQPPLYKLKKGKTEFYAYDDKERDEIIERLKKDSPKAKKEAETDDEGSEEDEETTVAEELKEAKKFGITLSRFKGLGEMNPDQLWDTTMNPDTRTLLQVTIGEASQAAMIFQTLMGDKVEPRREFIEKNAQYVKNLDV
jgi:DNA gyrase subunit B